MIDFITLQGLTIPEGVVTQITDKSGRVLWEANSCPKITILGLTTDALSELFDITIDGQTYMGNCGTVELAVPVGTLVECSVAPNMLQAAAIRKGSSYANSTVLAETPAKTNGQPVTYSYEVVSDTTFTMEVRSFTANLILITDE